VIFRLTQAANKAETKARQIAEGVAKVADNIPPF